MVENHYYINVSDSELVLGAITAWIIGLKLLSLHYADCCSHCRLVASLLYSSKVGFRSKDTLAD